MTTNKYPTRTITIRDSRQIETLLNLIPNLPIRAKKPIQVIIREEIKVRSMSANDCMWACQLKCISEQAYVQSRTYADTTWHEMFKDMYLPETFLSPEHQAEIVKDGYKKYDIRPDGKRVLVGSTTELTTKGFSIYLQQVEAYGANLGVIYSANPNEAYT